MSGGTNAPIIIKRKKVVGGDGHHGGAWKVAYADFVTAMMAFFMLMWLLNATTEQQRKGIADYFSPTIPINRISGGGDGALGGDSIHTRDSLAESGRGGVAEQQGDGLAVQRETEWAAETAQLEDLEAELLGLGGETILSDNAMRHIVTRITDEGLVIELFDVPGAALFDGDSATPRRVTEEIALLLARILSQVDNRVALTGHVRAQSVVRVDYPVWDLSTDRADSLRRLVEEGGILPSRIARLTGHADREPAVADPQAVRNNRVELVVLRSDI